MKQDYQSFNILNGDHSLKKAAPESVVEYSVRLRPGGEVSYFNFELAQQMGLIEYDHAPRLNEHLIKKIIETFSLVIINEYDLAHNVSFLPQQIKPNKYMATRYLQVQHPDKRGLTSGDGRGIWNGQCTHKGITWDVISSGTGATRLSPAVAREKKFFKTGDPEVAYGCGYNDFDSGLSAALMSEVFHKNKIATERTLALITFKDGTSINVRAGQNLMRPSHFFCHLKQGKYHSLKKIVDYFIDRQVMNKKWPATSTDHEKYHYFVHSMARTFAKIAADFESNYIFVWLDWDGDNILADGGIIDYGSVRQFGLYHHRYRYDDVERFSTTIAEQKKKAAYIVQTFAQLQDFLLSARKKPIGKFVNSPVLKTFYKHFDLTLQENFLHNIGFSTEQRKKLLTQHASVVYKFHQVFSYFEKKQSLRGIYKTNDGITADAIFCMRDILREWPQYYLKTNKLMSPKEFIEIIKSSYARKKDLKMGKNRIKKIESFQLLYLELINCLEAKQNRILPGICMRASVINRYDRITGSSIIYVTEHLIKNKRKLESSDFHKIFNNFVAGQKFIPELLKKHSPNYSSLNPRASKILKQAQSLVQQFRECI